MNSFKTYVIIFCALVMPQIFAPRKPEKTYTGKAYSHWIPTAVRKAENDLNHIHKAAEFAQEQAQSKLEEAQKRYAQIKRIARAKKTSISSEDETSLEKAKATANEREQLLNRMTKRKALMEQHVKKQKHDEKIALIPYVGGAYILAKEIKGGRTLEGLNAHNYVRDAERLPGYAAMDYQKTIGKKVPQTLVPPNTKVEDATEVKPHSKKPSPSRFSFFKRKKTPAAAPTPDSSTFTFDNPLLKSRKDTQARAKSGHKSDGSTSASD